MDQFFALQTQVLKHKIEKLPLFIHFRTENTYLINNNDFLIHCFFKTCPNKFGNLFAHYELGKMYESGVVTKQDLHKAYSLYKIAADGRNPFANYRLGIMYRDGKGVEKDELKSQRYLQKAKFVLEKKRS